MERGDIDDGIKLLPTLLPYGTGTYSVTPGRAIYSSLVGLVLDKHQADNGSVTIRHAGVEPAVS